jgi:hypothetical protein
MKIFMLISIGINDQKLLRILSKRARILLCHFGKHTGKIGRAVGKGKSRYFLVQTGSRLSASVIIPKAVQDFNVGVECKERNAKILAQLAISSGGWSCHCIQKIAGCGFYLIDSIVVAKRSVNCKNHIDGRYSNFRLLQRAACFNQR